MSRVVDCRVDRLRGDLVEHHPTDRDLGLQLVEQVPGDRLALTVLVGREVQLVGILQQGLELGDLRLLVLGHDIDRREAVVDVDAESTP